MMLCVGHKKQKASDCALASPPPRVLTGVARGTQPSASTACVVGDHVVGGGQRVPAARPDHTGRADLLECHYRRRGLRRAVAARAGREQARAGHRAPRAPPGRQAGQDAPAAEDFGRPHAVSRPSWAERHVDPRHLAVGAQSPPHHFQELSINCLCLKRFARKSPNL